MVTYMVTIWSPMASTRNNTKLQYIQNTALLSGTGCALNTNTQHLHDKTNILALHIRLNLQASQTSDKNYHKSKCCTLAQLRMNHQSPYHTCTRAHHHHSVIFVTHRYMKLWLNSTQLVLDAWKGAHVTTRGSVMEPSGEERKILLQDV